MEGIQPLLKLALLGTTLAVLAGFLAPRGLLSIAAISLKPSLVAASFVLAVALLVSGAPIAATFAASLALLGWLMLAPFYKPSPDIQDPDVTFVWANTLKRQSALEKAVALAEREGASLVLAAEAPFGAEAPEGWHIRSAEHRPVLILSREAGALAEVLEAEDRTATAVLDNEPFDIVATHAAMPLSSPRAPARRQRDLDQLAALDHQHPKLFVGDYNTVPWSHALLDLEADYGLERVGIGAKTTWLSPLLFLGLPIDHVLVPSSIAASAKVGPGLGSDHRPLIVKAQLKR
ncbi:hypothetical protein HK107_03500 [Parvularcula sp. ZS-1/3]|uniref:Endonuclease/exonuclease/phosphatase domain-containing protein n=1 Tax=Parvularcula mediterranea TaxID=2732508 RepID=A0A7Y3RJT1_9PROT|nr:endonuclease/exonuclease/phosphatase family protein [Parvularcula mediterranea]NNU15392.1 hypothetical protein [Parvularcula mediterranea]